MKRVIRLLFHRVKSLTRFCKDARELNMIRMTTMNNHKIGKNKVAKIAKKLSQIVKLLNQLKIIYREN